MLRVFGALATAATSRLLTLTRPLQSSASISTAVDLIDVPRPSARRARNAINVAPLPQSVATRLAGSSRRRAPFTGYDGRNFLKEASVISGFPTFMRPLRRQERRRKLREDTITQTGEIMKRALKFHEKDAIRSAKELAAASNILRFQREKRNRGAFFARYVTPVRYRDRPARVGGEGPLVTQRGTLGAVVVGADVTTHQPIFDQALSLVTTQYAQRVAREQARVDAALGGLAAAAAAATPPPMAGGRVLGSGGAAWGAAHPEAERLATATTARAAALSGWLHSIPAGQALMRAARQGGGGRGGENGGFAAGEGGASAADISADSPGLREAKREHVMRCMRLQYVGDKQPMPPSLDLRDLEKRAAWTREEWAAQPPENGGLEVQLAVTRFRRATLMWPEERSAWGPGRWVAEAAAQPDEGLLNELREVVLSSVYPEPTFYAAWRAFAQRLERMRTHGLTLAQIQEEIKEARRAQAAAAVAGVAPPRRRSVRRRKQRQQVYHKVFLAAPSAEAAATRGEWYARAAALATAVPGWRNLPRTLKASFVDGLPFFRGVTTKRDRRLAAQAKAAAAQAKAAAAAGAKAAALEQAKVLAMKTQAKPKGASDSPFLVSQLQEWGHAPAPPSPTHVQL